MYSTDDAIKNLKYVTCSVYQCIDDGMFWLSFLTADWEYISKRPSGCKLSSNHIIKPKSSWKYGEERKSRKNLCTQRTREAEITENILVFGFGWMDISSHYGSSFSSSIIIKQHSSTKIKQSNACRHIFYPPNARH